MVPVRARQTESIDVDQQIDAVVVGALDELF